MTSDFSLNKTKSENSFGYHDGAVETVISVDDVNRQAQELAETISKEKIASLIQGEPFLKIEGLHAGYGKMEILHDFNLQIGKGQSLCMIGPNGAGKSTVLHSIFGFTNIFSGEIKTQISDSETTITKMSSNQKLEVAGISYILQDNSVFPEMTVEENLMMGGYLKENTDAAQESTERIFEKYDRLKARRNNPAKVLSGGERRLLEISRSLVMEPDILLVDEPSIGLEPRFIDMVFEILDDLQRNEGKTIIMVEQNAKKGLEFCDIGYVLVSGNLAMADSGENLLANPDVGRLFLGG
ncbi:MAG: ABC transporter ATP-binding protein [SAR324 cluster bacterium]|nr:ABC transporter ATP-binding protein [SAR324 cluster bacterium]MDP6742908.1 ABC transporter ATP-binding protein [SAR324 cluster bacterium]